MESEVRSQTTFNDLHHYALLQICEKVDNLYDQVAFAKTCTEVCTTYVEYIWRFAPNILSLGPTDLAADAKTRRLHFYYVRHMQKYLKKFELGYNSNFPSGLAGYLEKLKEMGIKEFPAITHCEIDRMGVIPDLMMLRLSEFMPNLKTLKLVNQHLTGCYIRNFKHLEELQLRNTYIRPRILTNIFSNLSCLHTLDVISARNRIMPHIIVPTLKVLRIDANSAERIISSIVNLPQLEELEVVYNEKEHYDCYAQFIYNGISHVVDGRRYYNIFPHVFAKKAKFITSLKLNNWAVMLQNNWDKKLPITEMPKLTELTFRYWEGDKMFLDAHLNNSNLQILSVGDWMTNSPRHLSALATKFKQLKILELYTSASDYFAVFQQIRSSLQYSNRSNQLLLKNWYHLLPAKELEHWMPNKVVKAGFSNDEFFPRGLYGFIVKFDNSPSAENEGVAEAEA